MALRLPATSCIGRCRPGRMCFGPDWPYSKVASPQVTVDVQ